MEVRKRGLELFQVFLPDRQKGKISKCILEHSKILNKAILDPTESKSPFVWRMTSYHE